MANAIFFYFVLYRKVSKDNSTSNDDNLRLALEEKEQSLLASQETVQVCNHVFTHVNSEVKLSPLDDDTEEFLPSLPI